MNFKQIFLTTSFLVISNFLFAQAWSLNELIKLSSMNVDDADTYITSKGYDFYSIKPESWGEERTYTGNKTSIGTGAAYWLTVYFYTGEYQKYKIGICWETSKTQQYTNIKKQLKLAGFVFKTSEILDDGSSVFKYSKNKSDLHLRVKNEEFNTIHYVITYYFR